MLKSVRTPEYNYNFDTRTGYFERWGKTFEDDPQFSPIGPELADIEISTICNNNCPHCYKSNTSEGQNMSLETFRKVLNKLPPTVLQIAFGIGSHNVNPDMFEIFDYCKKNDVVPNVTISGNDEMTYATLSEFCRLCGAVAVSNYDKNKCYSKVEVMATAFKHPQINIHQLLSEETFDKCLEVVKDSKTDYRLSDLNAIVFLSLKKKGRGKNYHKVSDEHFKKLVKYCLDNNVRFGFDSCTANKFMKCIKDLDVDQKLIDKLCVNVESCESGLFSIYIDVNGFIYPCSFTENLEKGINLLTEGNFLENIWFGSLKKWRRELLNNCRSCPRFNI